MGLDSTVDLNVLVHNIPEELNKLYNDVNDDLDDVYKLHIAAPSLLNNMLGHMYVPI